MKMRRSWLGSLVGGMTLLVLASLSGSGLAAPVTAGQPPAPVAQATPAKATGGTVTAATLNVRGRPSTTSPVVGKLRRGDRVQITSRRTGWLEIVFNAGPGGRGWVSASLVAVDGEKTTSSAKPAGVPAPTLVDYRLPNFMWKWSGQSAVKGQDWYFDILLFRSGDNQPYDTLAVEPGQATNTNGTWTFGLAYDFPCDSSWVMAIAVRKEGKWAGWVSPMSNRLSVGPSCACFDPCPGCGDGGCGG